MKNEYVTGSLLNQVFNTRGLISDRQTKQIKFRKRTERGAFHIINLHINLLHERMHATATRN